MITKPNAVHMKRIHSRCDIIIDRLLIFAVGDEICVFFLSGNYDIFTELSPSELSTDNETCAVHLVWSTSIETSTMFTEPVSLVVLFFHPFLLVRARSQKIEYAL